MNKVIISQESITIQAKHIPELGAFIRIEQDNDIIVVTSPNGLRKLIETLIGIENAEKRINSADHNTYEHMF